MRLTGIITLIALTLSMATAQTFGMVDFERVINESELAKKSLTELEGLQRQFNGVLQTLQDSLLVTDEERQELMNLIALPTPTDAQKQRAQAIVGTARQRSEELATLRQKPNPTETEKAALDRFTQMETKSREALQGMAQQLDQQLQTRLNESRQKVRNEIKSVIATVAKEKKVTVVFDASGVLFCDNDLTEEVIKRLNAKKTGATPERGNNSNRTATGRLQK
jgi:Skp family chaperone for outer membrane proteins